MTTKKEFAYLVAGIGIGVYVPKVIPKTKIVRHVKFLKEVLAAKFRLDKILIEEYHRIDEAIEAENAFLNAIHPGFKVTPNATFSVKDDGEERHIHVHLDFKGMQESAEG